jgi:hypothetical protein
MSEEQASIEATFEFVENDPIEATFSISPNIQDLNYVYYQNNASDTWTVEHNLGKFPSVTVVDKNGDTVLTDVNYIDANTVEIVFNGAFAGKAYLN